MSVELSAIISGVPEIISAATLVAETSGQSFTEITHDAARFLSKAQAKDGSLLIFMRHTSASLVIQENADPDVRADLATALARVAPDDAGWVHDVEGRDDMPAHVKTMFTGVSLHVPVSAGALALGTWQGIYVATQPSLRRLRKLACAHRALPHRREVVLQFIGSRR